MICAASASLRIALADTISMQNSSRIDLIIEKRLLPFFLPVWLELAGHYILEQCGMQKDRLFLWSPVVFAIGIGVYFSLSSEPPFILSVFLLVVVLSLYSLIQSSKPYISIIVFTLLLFILGFTSAHWRTLRVGTPVLTEKISYTRITGYVHHTEKLDEGQGSRVILDVHDIEDLDPKHTPRKVRLTLRSDETIRVGQHVRVLAGLNPPSLPLIPDGFNFRRYLFFKQIGAVGFIYHAPEVISAPEHSNHSFIGTVRHGWAGAIEKLRQNIELRIYDALAPDQASLSAALLVGKKNAISDSDRQAVRDAGLAHMLSISGLHVGIFSGTLFFALRFAMACIPFLALHYPIKKIAAVLALLGAVFYMFLAGTTVPTQRAVLMSAVVFFSIILDRSPISMRLVAASALVVLAFRPESLISVSFQMSFAAVLSLIYFYDVTRPLWIKLYAQASFLHRLMLYFLGICITTVVASVATAPFALYHFGQVSFVGSVANLVAVPLLGFIIMPMALLSLFLMPLGLDSLALQVMGLGIEGMLEISYWAASLPYAVFYDAMWPFSAFVILVCGSLFVMLWKGWGKVVAIPFLFSALMSTQQHIMPDILVSDSHKLFLFKEERHGETVNLYTSSLRRERFVLENWQKLYGLPVDSAMLLNYKGDESHRDSGLRDSELRSVAEDPFHQCGEQGCRFYAKGHHISFVRNPYILREECAWADIVISVEPVPNHIRCRASFVIDKFDTWRRGTHAIWLMEEGDVDLVRIETTSKSLGNRPWNFLP